MSVSPINDARLYSISKLADLFGHTRETVAKKIKEGGAAPSGKLAGYPAYALRDVATLTGGLQIAAETPFRDCDPDSLPPKDRDSWFSSENKRIAFEVKTGQLLDRNEVAQGLAECLKKVALTFDTLADVLERDVGLNPDQIARINEIADNIRSELAVSIIGDKHEPS